MQSDICLLTLLDSASARFFCEGGAWKGQVELGSWVCLFISLLVMKVIVPWLPHFCAASLPLSLGLAAIDSVYLGQYVASAPLTLWTALWRLGAQILYSFFINCGYNGYWNMYVASISVLPSHHSSPVCSDTPTFRHLNTWIHQMCFCFEQGILCWNKVIWLVVTLRRETKWSLTLPWC